MLLTLKICQVIISVLLILMILIQAKGSGLSYGIKSSFSMYRSLRGVERLVFITTFIVCFLLVVNSLAILLL
jgi:preprotein translocase subunit SecG